MSKNNELRKDVDYNRLFHFMWDNHGVKLNTTEMNELLDEVVDCSMENLKLRVKKKDGMHIQLDGVNPTFGGNG